MNKTLQTNIDLQTGIRYGVIHQNDVLQAWADESEPNYGDIWLCPHCGKQIAPSEEIFDWCDYENATEEDKDSEWFCVDCQIGTDEPDSPEEPINYLYEKEGYQAVCGDSGNIFVIKSPYYTETRLCSPCAPNAGDLSSPEENGFKVYCFSHAWFDGEKAPYPVYKVEDDSLVE
jgi:hypothetical protein